MSDEPNNQKVAGEADAASATEAPLEEQVRRLEEEVKKLEGEKASLWDQLVRRQADFENYRKRAEREQQEFRQAAEADLVAALLPVLDGFERALAPPTAGQAAASEGNEADYRKGVELIYKQLFDLLARAGLKPVEAQGKKFDPFFHHALERLETTEHPDQEVLAELQRGYTFKQRLLRPALVRVAVRPNAKKDSEAGG